MNIVHFTEIDSTNTYVKKNIEALDDKTIITADKQTKGRGRFDRTWTDLGSENIYMTIALKPSTMILPVYANLTQYLSLCLCKKFEELGLNPQIKWPNDVLLNGKKVCGILAESVFRGRELKGIALGIGVNLNASIANLSEIDRPATSLNIELGKAFDKDDFMRELLEEFFLNYHEFLQKGFPMIKNDYLTHAFLLNKPVKIAIFDKVIEGIFTTFDEDGSIILTMPCGKFEKINMGEFI